MAGEVLVGTGGWMYFNIPAGDRLREYSRAFDFVEVNTTFYGDVPASLCSRWRERVPESFVFTVKCSREVTHVYGFRPVEEAYEAFERMVRICRILYAPLLVLEIPRSLRLDGNAVTSFFASADLKGVRAGLEIRGRADKSCYRAMQDMGLIHVADLSRVEPRYYDPELTYSRLFGRGRHNIYQFDDQELVEINSRGEKAPSKRVMLSFHGLKMYVDAARLKAYRMTGTMPPVTGKIGLESLMEVLAEDTTFPATKDEIIARHGWKLFDHSPTKRIRVAEALKHIPNKKYQNIEELRKVGEEIFSRKFR
jgi:uncharacterized protein YecE (DUF72 family)